MAISTVIPLEIWDCPGNITVQDLGTPLSEFSSMVFVIDIRVRDVISMMQFYRCTDRVICDRTSISNQ